MSDEKNHDAYLNYFFALGIIWGGAVPVTLVAGGDLLCRSLIKDNCQFIPDQTQIPFLCITGLFLLMSFVGFGIQHEKLWPEAKQGIVLILAIISWLALNGFVFTTGGALASVFSFHYLYIPAVVAAHSYFSAKTIEVTKWAYGFSFVFMLILHAVHHTYNVHQTWMYYLIYGMVFLLQLVLAVKLARVGESLVRSTP